MNSCQVVFSERNSYIQSKSSWFHITHAKSSSFRDSRDSDSGLSSCSAVCFIAVKQPGRWSRDVTGGFVCIVTQYRKHVSVSAASNRVFPRSERWSFLRSARVDAKQRKFGPLPIIALCNGTDSASCNCSPRQLFLVTRNLRLVISRRSIPMLKWCPGLENSWVERSTFLAGLSSPLACWAS